MIILLGDGGHAEVVTDCFDENIDRRVLAPGLKSESNYFIEEADAISLDPGTIQVLNGLGFLGGPNRRGDLFDKFKAAGFAFARVIDSSAVVRSSATLGEGVQVLVGAVLNSSCSIGKNTIINTRSVVEHHVRIGAHCHIAPSATICGAATIGDGVFVGAGAIVLPGIFVFPGSVVGAGAVVTESYTEPKTIVGIPARPLKRNMNG